MVTCGGPPRLQRRALELHDSRLVRWEMRGPDLVVHLAGYVHQSLGVPGTDRGTGWAQDVELTVRAAQVTRQPRELPLWILDGEVEAGQTKLERVPVPFEAAGPVRVRAGGGEGELAVSGTGLTLTAVGEARFVERFEGAG
jgi:hypothetical protein